LQRGTLLGETPLNTGPRSVFDYISVKDRERLKTIATATASGLPVPAPLSVPRIGHHMAEAALKGFQPFASDPQKQERYTIYLRSQISEDDPLLQALPNQRPDEFQKEVEDYAKAATIFKPVSGAMAGRFQSATHIDQGPKIHEGLHQPTTAELEASEERRKNDEEEKLSPQEHAAKLGMYGPMTREVKPWQPARLLCKRFGLKEPEMSQQDVDMSSSSTKNLSFTTSEAEEAFRQVAGSAEASSSSQVQSSSSGPRDLANIGLGEDENQGRDTLTYQRPAMDIFKAIFASDDEDSDTEKVDDEESKAPVEKLDMPVDGVAPPVSHSLLDNGPVDLSNFKPTFKLRTGKAKAKKENDEGRSKSKKSKEKKKKDKKGPIVSFDVEAGADEGSLPDVLKEAPKKQRKDHKRHDDDDDGMWVEKLPPEIVNPSPSVAVVSQAPSTLDLTDEPVNETDMTVNARRGRKRAIDFL